MTLYTLRGSITTSMERAKLPHLALRYLTGHTTGDILNVYTGIDPVAAADTYFGAVRPLLKAIEQRARALQIGG